MILSSQKMHSTYSRKHSYSISHPHIHHFSSNVSFAGRTQHKHYFTGTTTKEILLLNGDHKHVLSFETDPTIDHAHKIYAETSSTIYLEDGTHLHFVKAIASVTSAHVHELIFTTSIENIVVE